MERIVPTWRTEEKRQCGIGEMEGWRDIRWREDRGLWLVWSEPRVRLAVSMRRIMMPMKRPHPRRPVLSVLAQVGTSRHILPTFLNDDCVFSGCYLHQKFPLFNFRVRFTFLIWHFKHRCRTAKAYRRRGITAYVDIPVFWNRSITFNQQTSSSSSSLPSCNDGFNWNDWFQYLV